MLFINRSFLIPPLLEKELKKLEEPSHVFCVSSTPIKKCRII